MNGPRIAFSGSAGTGKSTLAQAVAKRMGLPYIEEGMRKRVDQGLALYKMNDAERRDLMRDMWREQLEQEQSSTEGFVSDRSSVDFAAFWLHYALTDAESETADFMNEMERASTRTDHIILCPWGTLPLVADGVRSTNPWLQLRFHALLEGMHQRMSPAEKVLRLPESVTDFEERLELVLKALA
jgi:nicotinamide riboside kinase